MWCWAQSLRFIRLLISRAQYMNTSDRVTDGKRRLGQYSSYKSTIKLYTVKAGAMPITWSRANNVGLGHAVAKSPLWFALTWNRLSPAPLRSRGWPWQAYFWTCHQSTADYGNPPKLDSRHLKLMLWRTHSDLQTTRIITTPQLSLCVSDTVTTADKLFIVI